jgi:hypothetical protein
MAQKHILKLTETEAVLKCYITNPAGGTIDISLQTDLTGDDETFIGDPIVTIQEIFWGAKKDKQIDLTRIVPSDPTGVHGHYYLTNSGSYDFVGFVDSTYASKDIRIIGDGAFHVIIKLRKVQGWSHNN